MESAIAGRVAFCLSENVFCNKTFRVVPLLDLSKPLEDQIIKNKNDDIVLRYFEHIDNFSFTAADDEMAITINAIDLLINN